MERSGYSMEKENRVKLFKKILLLFLGRKMDGDSL